MISTSLLAVAIPLPSAVAAPPAPTSPATFGIEAAQATHPDARAYLSYGVTVGARISDHVALVNYGPTPLTLRLYATDAVAAADGGITFAQATAKPKDAGSWFTVGAARTVTVPARRAGGGPGLVIAPVTMSVPQGVAPGDHVAGLVASLLVGGSAGGTPVRLDQRVVERVYIRVAGTLRPQLRVEGIRLRFGQPINPVGDVGATVSWTVHNTGNVLLSATQDVHLSGLFGSSVSVQSPPAITRLLPGARISFTAHVARVRPGLRLSANVTLRPSAALSGDVDGRLSPVRRGAAGWAWIATGVVTLLLAAVAFLLWRRYWPYEEVPEAPEDASAPRAPASAGRR